METTDDLQTFADMLLPQEEAVETEAAEQVPEEETTEAPVDNTAQGDDAAETVDADQSEPERITVKVDGKDVAVTLDDLKRSYSGQAYIQAGMKQAAEARKEAEALRTSLQTERQQILGLAEQIQKGGIARPPAEPDVAMLDRDPIGYIQLKAQYDAEMKAYEGQQAQMRTLQQQAAANEAAQMRQIATEQAELLKQRIPEFADTVKAAALKERLVKTAVDAYGYSPEEVGSITDARAVQVLHDAAQWRALQAGKAMAKTTPDAPRNVKPVAKTPDAGAANRQKLVQQAQKSNSTEDWAKVLLG